MSAPLLFADIFDRWVEYRRKLCDLNAIQRSTLANNLAIAAMLKAEFGAYVVGELTRSALELWARERLLSHRPVTVIGELNLLTQIANWAMDEGLTTSRPKMPKIPNPTTEHRLPSDDAFVWYLRNLPVPHVDAVHFMMLTGLSPHELARIQPRDFRAPDEIVIGGRASFLVKAEARRRSIPLNDWALTIWFRCSTGLQPDAAVFPKEGTVQKAMRRLYLASPEAPPECDGLTPKMMRKWFASKVALEHSEAVLQTLMGHAPGSPITRRHYVRTQENHRRDAVRKLQL